MRRIALLFAAITVANFSAQETKSNSKSNSNLPQNRLKSLFSQEKLNNLLDVHNSIPKDTASSIPFSNKDVALWDELILLFDPSSFDCGCESAVKSRIKSLKTTEGDTRGFVPSAVTAKIGNEPAYKVQDFDQSVLLGSFIYKIKSDPEPKSAYVAESDLLKEVDMDQYIILNGSNFLYTNDCSGYISAIVKANAGLTFAQMNSSIKAASNQKKSLVVLQAYYKSPIYYHYRSKPQTINAIKLKRDLIDKIMYALPNYARLDDTEIIFTHDYKILATSNSGDSSFNGESSFNADVKASYGIASGELGANANGKITKGIKFANFNTYVIAINKVNQPDRLTYKDLKDLLNVLDAEIAKTPLSGIPENR